MTAVECHSRDLHTAGRSLAVGSEYMQLLLLTHASQKFIYVGEFSVQDFE